MPIVAEIASRLRGCREAREMSNIRNNARVRTPATSRPRALLVEISIRPSATSACSRAVAVASTHFAASHPRRRASYFLVLAAKMWLLAAVRSPALVERVTVAPGRLFRRPLRRGSRLRDSVRCASSHFPTTRRGAIRSVVAVRANSPWRFCASLRVDLRDAKIRPRRLHGPQPARPVCRSDCARPLVFRP